MNDKVKAHMALVDELADLAVGRFGAVGRDRHYREKRAAVEASAIALHAEQAVIDKAELKRLVSLVFGDDFQIVRQQAAPTDPDCPRCKGSEIRGFKRGLKCPACNGSGNAPETAARPSEPPK